MVILGYNDPVVFDEGAANEEKLQIDLNIIIEPRGELV